MGVAAATGVAAALRLALVGDAAGWRPALVRVELAWLIRVMRLIWGSIVHRIHRITLIHHVISAGAGRACVGGGQIEVSGLSGG